MVEVESATDLLECRGVEANASSRLVAAGTGEVREDVGKLGDQLTDNFVSRADGSTGRSDPLVVLPEGVHPAVITTPDRPLSLALISLICAISMV